MTQGEQVRIDKWLWAARFFKTRSMAARAVSGGHVHVGGRRVKPSRIVQVGDQLEIRRGLSEFVVTVLDISDRRGPASVARQLYEETPDSIRRREMKAEERRLARTDAPAPLRKPDKRDRRKIRKFTRRDD
jgi:ribosome-associated heat shock protein Hsp15